MQLNRLNLIALSISDGYHMIFDLTIALEFDLNLVPVKERNEVTTPCGSQHPQTLFIDQFQLLKNSVFPPLITHKGQVVFLKK